MKAVCCIHQENHWQFNTAHEYYIFTEYFQNEAKNQNCTRKLKQKENLPVTKFSCIHSKA